MEEIRTTGGVFGKAPFGIAVNATTGDVYVADSNNNRIQRFSATGTFKEAWGRNVDAINPETGYERCTVAANCQAATTAGSPNLGGEFNLPAGIAVDQANGNVYVIDGGNRRVQEFTEAGAFIRAFGQDVVSSGTDNAPPASAVQSLSVTATGGKYTLTFQGQSTAELAFNSTAAQVKAALEGLSSISAGNIEVTGASSPFTIAFKGVLANSPQPPIAAASAAGEPLTGGSASITSTTTGSTGFEVCVAANGDICKAAAAATNTAGAFGTFGVPGTTATNVGSGLTVAPAGSPNAGNVLVADAGNRRVQEFSAAGQFVRAFGWNVTTAGPDNKNFASGPERADELQKVTVRASSGEFKLSFGSGGPGISETGNISFGAGAGEVQNALNALTNISTGGGSVTVTGGPGDVAGTSPYEVSFNGGPLAGKDVAQMGGVNIGLAGGTPNSGITVTTIAPGNSGFEVCNASAFDVCGAGLGGGAGKGQFAINNPSRVAEDGSGRIYTVEPTENFRVQRFTLPGNVPTPQGEFAAAALHGSALGFNTVNAPRDITNTIAVDPGGAVYAVKSFPAGTGVPAAEVTTAGTRSQQRILRIDPATETVTDTIAANPGVSDNATFANPVGLALRGGTIYALTAEGGASFGRVWKIGQFAPPAVSDVGATEVNASSAVLEATVQPSPISLETAYRFEYSSDGITWTPAPVPDAKIGNGSGGGEAGTCPTPPAAVCHISRGVAGLVPHTEYQVRLVTYTIFNAVAAKTTVGAPFITLVNPPQVSTGVGVWSGPPASGPSLLLGGTINPGNDRTTYQFQYVDDGTYRADRERAEAEGKGSAEAEEAGYQHAASIPAAVADAGHGLTPVAVHQVLAGLDPGHAYDFRLIAANSVGVTRGATRVISPPTPGTRFYELVSAGESWGQGAGTQPLAVADDGGRAMFGTLAFGQPRSVPGVGVNYVSERAADGWRVADMSPDPARAVHNLFSEATIASDLGSMLWTESSAAEKDRSEAQFGLARNDGSLVAASPPLVPLQRNGSNGYTVTGTSADLSTVVFAFNLPGKPSGSVTLLPGESLVTPNFSNLYEIHGAGTVEPQLRIVNRANGKAGPVIGGACGAWIGTTGTARSKIASHAVSADGSVVYFSARSGAPTEGACPTKESDQSIFGGSLRLFKRVGGETTVEVSAPQCTPTPACPGSPDGDDEFWGASDGGSVVFFTTARRLVNSDTNNGNDLYVYDASPPSGQPNLAQASLGNGSEAKVLGVLDNANDGSRAYFVAEGALTGENTVLHRTPVAGNKNLYVYERDDLHPAGQITFIGALAVGGFPVGDQNEWESGLSGRKSAVALPLSGEGGDGHALLFVSAAQLLPVDTDTAYDLYLYDESATEAAKALRCVSCAGTQSLEIEAARWGASAVSRGDRAQEVRGASEDLSKAVFTTREQLLPADENSVADVYLWEALDSGRCSTAASAAAGPAYVSATGGCLTLVSVGAEAQGSESLGFGGAPVSASISPDGRNVFFTTRASLVGTDTNGAPDLYDARIDGGFPEQQQPEGCEGSDACQVAPVPLAAPPSPSSAAPSAGNVPRQKPCGKGKVRRHGKCVKRKPAKHKHKKQKRANHGRGGSR